MKNITITGIRIHNFAGIRDLNIAPGENGILISGKNGTCKTTIGNAITWLLFNKDMNGKEFTGIKTLSTDGIVIPMIDHGVRLTLKIDALEPMVLGKIFKEKWTTAKGEKEAKMTGNVTVYEIDGVIVKASDFADKVDDICPESVFRMLSNPMDFSRMHWQDQRKFLFDMANLKTDLELATEYGFEYLQKYLQNNGIENIRKSVAASQGKIKKEIELIPARVDELNLQMPDLAEVDKAEKDLLSLKDKRKQAQDVIDGNVSSQADKNSKVKAIDDDISELNTLAHELKEDRLAKERQDTADARANLEKQIFEKWETVEDKKREMTADKKIRELLAESIKEKTEALATLKTEHTEIQDFNYDEAVQKECYACGRAFEEEGRATQIADMKVSNSKRLTDLAVNAKALKKDIVDFLQDSKTTKRQIDDLFSDIASIEADRLILVTEKEEIKITVKPSETESKNTLNIKDAKERKAELTEGTNLDQAQYIVQRDGIDKQIEEVKLIIARKDTAKSLTDRLIELNKKQKELSITLAKQGKYANEISEFTARKIAMVESNISDHFSKNIRFKMYRVQLNEETNPTCEVMMDDKPYSHLSTGERIMCGLRLIAGISKWKDIRVPVIVDNHESFTKDYKWPGQAFRMAANISQDKLTITNI